MRSCENDKIKNIVRKWLLFFLGFLYFRTASISLVNIFHIHIRLATIKTPLMRNDIFFGRFRTIVSMKNRVKISRFFREKMRKKYTRKR